MLVSSDEVLRLAADLSACLDEEKAALAAGQTEILSDTTLRKSILVDRLERASLSKGESLDPRAERELIEVLQRCRQQNLANAALVEARMNQIRWALNQLGAGGASVYGRDGKTQNQFTPREVGSA